MIIILLEMFSDFLDVFLDTSFSSFLYPSNAIICNSPTQLIRIHPLPPPVEKTFKASEHFKLFFLCHPYQICF